MDDNQRKAEKLMDETQPVLLIGSVMCTMFSVMKTLFRPHMGEEKFQKELKKARRDLNFVVSLMNARRLLDDISCTSIPLKPAAGKKTAS